MTAPEDPFRSPTPGAPPPDRDPAGRPVDPYGTSAPSDGQQQPGQQPYGQPSGAQPSGAQPYGAQPYSAQPYGAQPYGAQPYGAPGFGVVRQAPRNGLGIAALVLGILSVLTGLFVIGGLLGLVAIVLGALGRGRAKRGEATNGGMALAGIVLGVVGILLTVLVIALGVSYADEFVEFGECLNGAGGDPVAEQQCETRFVEELTG